jgi:hypothetical protein
MPKVPQSLPAASLHELRFRRQTLPKHSRRSQYPERAQNENSSSSISPGSATDSLPEASKPCWTGGMRLPLFLFEEATGKQVIGSRWAWEARVSKWDGMELFVRGTKQKKTSRVRHDRYLTDSGNRERGSCWLSVKQFLFRETRHLKSNTMLYLELFQRAMLVNVT